MSSKPATKPADYVDYVTFAFTVNLMSDAQLVASHAFRWRHFGMNDWKTRFLTDEVQIRNETYNLLETRLYNPEQFDRKISR